jgi:tRNA (mo5U34)-methyltransferase
VAGTRPCGWYGRRVQAQVSGLEGSLDGQWYHTIELAPGVVTPGWFDTRKIVPQLPFPASLAGARCLDVATFDGFWAFEMERRGADQVVAIDLLDPAEADWPVNSSPAVMEAIGERKRAGHGFETAHAALGSSVERIEMSVYDLDPAAVGQFDLVYVGSLLIHLRDPVRALERVRAVCGGRLLLVDNVDLALTLRHPWRPVAALDGVGRPWWWRMNLRALVRAVEAGGFRLVQPPKRIWMPPGPGQPPARVTRHLLNSTDARERLVGALKGDPHAVILAEPVLG